jgi:hypothetical protein
MTSPLYSTETCTIASGFYVPNQTVPEARGTSHIYAIYYAQEATSNLRQDMARAICFLCPKIHIRTVIEVERWRAKIHSGTSQPQAEELTNVLKQTKGNCYLDLEEGFSWSCTWTRFRSSG